MRHDPAKVLRLRAVSTPVATLANQKSTLAKSIFEWERRRNKDMLQDIFLRRSEIVPVILNGDECTVRVQ